MLVTIVVVGAVVVGYVALALPTRKRREEWKELTKEKGPPPSDSDFSP
jgi:hypothetical protein